MMAEYACTTCDETVTRDFSLAPYILRFCTVCQNGHSPFARVTDAPTDDSS